MPATEVTLFETARQFWLLIRLRYQLLWAQARTGAGRVALVVALYAIGATLFLFFNLGGIAAAAAAVRLGRGEAVARWVLAGIFLNSVFLSLALGAGPRATFTDQILRRYPLSAGARFAARHLVGLLDPIWPLSLATGLGLAIGFASLGAGSALAGVTAALLCTLASYLAAVVLLACAERSLEDGGGALALGALMFGVATAASVAAPLILGFGGEGWGEAVDRGLRYTPPGLAATLLAGPTGEVVPSAALLTTWCLVLAGTLEALERRPRSLPRASAAGLSWGNCYDRLAELFGPESAPLVGKALRYYLRCNRVRFNLAATVPLVALMGSQTGRGGTTSFNFLLHLSLAALAGIIPTSVVALNQFGCDGPGIRRYGLLPPPVAAALRAGSYASLMIGGAALLPTLAVSIVYSAAPTDARAVLMHGGAGAAGLFFFNSLGLWSSVLAPRVVDLRGMSGNVLSAAGNAIVLGGMIVLIAATVILGKRHALETLLEHWWVPAALAAVGLCFYAWSLRAVSQTLEANREKLFKTIAGAPGG